MAQAPNISAILSRPGTAIEKPKPLPVGTYLWLINQLPVHGKSKQKATPFVEFSVSPLQASEDVDVDALAEWQTKPDGSTRVLRDHRQRATFYITEDSAWRLRKFLEDSGIEFDGEKTMEAALDETAGRQLWGKVVHEASEDGTTVFAKFGDTAKAE